MKVVGSAVLGVDRKTLWTAFRDPAVLVNTIPGCERLEALGGDAYRMTITAGVASIKGVYDGEVALSDFREPESFVLKARGQGAPGTVDATVNVRLSETDEGTRVDYDAEAVVGGMIGGVGQRMLTSVAKKTAAEFFSAVERHLTTAPAAEDAAPTGTAQAPQPVPAQPVEAAVRTGQTFERPKQVRAKSETPPWPVLTAFGMGAAIALGSAVIGWLLGRTARRR
ncbi:SRPBCC family protein [Thermostaphylospora chromogena]|uniref:Carbon monoxide dehydrogenase subunit G n=1 Tax=Thermostaphylospora chromogena TaxID=35622 RepID=A0A1H1HVM9_9ACTN|nr:carbon monoxide dehydrogenase subunit G [Thermostaphylospora chromogena]SDR29532.1 hypothetical protein SAMN04489764_4878 [Thermostaphylospora chromogena]